MPLQACFKHPCIAAAQDLSSESKQLCCFVQQIVELFLEQWGRGSWFDGSDPTQPHEANILRLAIDKALWRLNWQPYWSVHESLRQTAGWYRHYFENGAPMRAFSEDQIAEYQAGLFAGATRQSKMIGQEMTQ